MNASGIALTTIAGVSSGGSEENVVTKTEVAIKK